jgi:hypothetical protein
MRVTTLVMALMVPQLGNAAGIVDTSDTPRLLVLDLRGSDYKPNIDDAFSSSGELRPYEETFDNQSELMFMVNLEMILVENYGTLSAGLGIGYWDVEGNTRRRTLIEGEATTGADTTKLQIIPTQLQASYRVDMWQEAIPIVPLLRAGLDYYFWEISDDDGNVTSFEPGQPAEGGTWGAHFSVGLQLYLDFLAPVTAGAFDREAGVNNSYITFEYQVAKVDDFGAKDSLRLGDETFFLGFTLDL